jgi:sigma-B regulation protein RsbU (phosphoserine phosphatase)
MMPPEMLEMLGKGYEERTLQMNAGDLFALYSDGVTEAYDEDENEWGDARLLECLRSVSNAPLQDMVAEVFKQIDNFAGAAPQHDDITLLLFSRNSQILT